MHDNNSNKALPLYFIILQYQPPPIYIKSLLLLLFHNEDSTISNMDHDEIKWSRLDFMDLIIIIIMYMNMLLCHLILLNNIIS